MLLLTGYQEKGDWLISEGLGQPAQGTVLPGWNVSVYAAASWLGWPLAAQLSEMDFSSVISDWPNSSNGCYNNENILVIFAVRWSHFSESWRSKMQSCGFVVANCFLLLSRSLRRGLPLSQWMASHFPLRREVAIDHWLPATVALSRGEVAEQWHCCLMFCLLSPTAGLCRNFTL